MGYNQLLQLLHPRKSDFTGVNPYSHPQKIIGKKIELEIIPEVDLYKCKPWDLPEKSYLPSKDMEWYFYSSRDRKYPNGSRTNRATRDGYWKATGKDRTVQLQKKAVGMKKTLVFYRGRAPHGVRTDWVMHEYHLLQSFPQSAPSLKDSYALCRVFMKSQVEDLKVRTHGGSNSDARLLESERDEAECCKLPSEASSELTLGSARDHKSVRAFIQFLFNRFLS